MSSDEGLRERKKRQTRERIQSTAIRLFVAQGYRDTTMEQVAEAADVSPRTVYRYFPTKDALVVTDAYDDLMMAAFRAGLAEHPPIEAIRRSFGLLIGTTDTPDDRHRRELIAAEPELQAAMLRFVADLARRYAEILVSEGHGRWDQDSALAMAGAVTGIALLTIRWDDDETTADQIRRLDRALDRLEHGFGLADAQPPAQGAPGL